MTKERDRKKIVVKKRTVRRLDGESLGKAKGGTGDDPWATVDCSDIPYEPPASYSFAFGGGRGNHNQAVRH